MRHDSMLDQAAVQRLAERPRVIPLANRMWVRLARTDRFRLAGAGVVMIIAAAGDAAVPVVIGGLVNQVIARPDITVAGPVTGQLLLIAGLLLGTQLLQVGKRQLVETVATGYERDTRTAALAHVLHLPARYFTDKQSGAVYSRTSRGIEGSTKLLKLSFMDFLPTVALAIAAVAVAMSRSVPLGLVMVAVIPTSLLLVRWQIRSQDGVRTRIRDTKEAIDGMVIEVLPAAGTVRAFHAEPFFAGKVRDGAGRLRDAEMTHHRAMGAFDAAKYGNEALWFVAVLTTAIVLVTRGSVGPGEILAAALLFQKVLTPVRELHRVMDESAESAKQAADLLVLLAEPRDPGYEPGPAGHMGPAVDDSVALALTGVLFGYPGPAGDPGPPVLNDITLRIGRGERIALVGRSGCGKSTVLKLVERLEHGYVGDIVLFGRPLEEFTHEDLAGRVAYVDQDPFLFRGSVRDNIVFGHPGPVTDAEIEFAARQAHIHGVVAELPDGYATIVHERGSSFSGGQRQRICLARALLRKPELLLLDEPTAALDNESQRSVRHAIDAITGVTIIEVAHRLDSVRAADRVVVLDGGLVVQQGTFPALAAVAGQFRDLLAQESEGTAAAARQAISSGGICASPVIP